MMKSMPWQDIYPLNNWKDFLSQYKLKSEEKRNESFKSTKATKGRNKRLGQHKFDEIHRLLSEPPIDDMINKLTRGIRLYHGIEKRSIPSLALRPTLLRAIAYTGQGFLTNYNIGEKASLIKERPGYKADRKLSLSYAVTKLVRRATRKAEYIDKLKEHVDSSARGFGGLGKKGLLEYLDKDSPQDDYLLDLVKDVRLEKLDPWHRPFEVTVGTSINTTHIFNLAFSLWQNTPTDLPLFVWLEGHFTCTGAFADDRAGNATKSELEKAVPIPEPRGHVSYRPDSDAINMTRFNGGLISAAPMPGVDGYKPLHTLRCIGKPLSNSAGMHAYVWTRDNMLLTAEHDAGKFHHSSFTEGDKVKCSGMIRAENGKVTKVNNDSGHYKPRTVHLKRFVVFLELQDVLNKYTAKVEDKTNDTVKTVYDFIFID